MCHESPWLTTVPVIHVVAKPMGPVSNLNCAYFFSLEKKALFKGGENFRMSDEALSAFGKGSVASQPAQFVWQGGEPTLAGLDFFRKVVHEQKLCMKEKTSGTLCRQTGPCRQEFSRRDTAKAEQRAQQQATMKANMGILNRAYSACLESKG